jgi:hypothetical protein
LTDPDADATELGVGVVRLFAERFAWHARRDLGADVALDTLDDDAALDALAEFLWAVRQQGMEPESPQP